MTRNVIGGKKEKRIPIDGIGGVFVYANDAKALSNWYAHHFGLRLETYEDGKVYGTEFKYRRLSDSSKVDSTVFSITQSKVPLPPERKEVVINYRVRDLPAFLEQLKGDGIEIEKTEDFDYGRFAWIKDPEGNRIELYQPLS
ncbi:MAG: VOC family protein [Gemmatimonadota bacterium]|nr:VOC family protein [Gemmatimonadota bacterium]